MATIKEMASEEAKRAIPDKYKSSMAIAIREGIVEAYVNGANAVLEEIENVIQPMIRNTRGRILDVIASFITVMLRIFTKRYKNLKKNSYGTAY